MAIQAIILFKIVIILSCKLAVTTSEMQNRNGGVSFGNYFKRNANGKIFVKTGSLIRKVTAKDESECLLKCVKEEQCHSINLYFDRPNDFYCELLNWGGTDIHSYLKPRANSYSMQLLKVCSPNPCQNGGQCVAATNGGHLYTCICTETFSGKNCELTMKSWWEVIFDFENGKKTGWTLTGTAFNNQPTYEDNSAKRGKPSNLQGNWWIGTYENRPSPSHQYGGLQGDGPKGTMTSPPFVIRGFYLRFLIGGGCRVQQHQRAELLIGANVVREKRARKCSERMNTSQWDVKEYRGQTAQIRLVDDYSEGFGHINFDYLEGQVVIYS